MASRQGVMEFYPLPRVSYGIAAAEAVTAEGERLGAKRIALIASTTLARKTDEIRLIERALGSRHVGTFTGVPAHAPETAVLKIAEPLRKARPDLLVSVGGGSVNDATKALLSCIEFDVHDLATLARHRARWENGRPQPADFAPETPMIAVPISLSASEFAPMGGLTDESTGIKNTYGSRKHKVAAVIFDPDITRHTPESLWLSTGVKAIDHTVETLGSLRSNDFCDGLAASALRLMADGLTSVKADPADRDARLKCQMGSWQASMPLAHTPMGLSHVLGYALGSLHHIPHGITSCLSLPAVCQWNSLENGARQQRISEVLGQPERPASDLLRELIGSLGMPTRLSDVGVSRADLRAIAEASIGGIYIPANPRPITRVEDIIEVLEIAL